LFFIPTELAAAREIINEFNAQSKTIHVQYEQSSWGSIGSKMVAAFSSGDVPDLFQYYDAGLVPWAANGLLADLKKLMPASTWTDVVPGTLSVLTTVSKGVIGLPFETETPVIYYRTDLLSKAGITPATVTSRWTWDQLRSYAQKLNNPKSGVFGIHANWASSELLFKNGLAWEAGANPIVVKNGQYSINVNDPGTKATIEYVRSWFADGIADPHSFAIDDQAYFAAGHSAMLLRGAWARSVIPVDKGGSTLKWAVMPFVKGPKANLGTGAAQTLSIPSLAKNKEAAAEFLTWWGKPANVAKICQASAQVPPNSAAVAELKASVGTTDFWNIALSESPDLQGQPFCPGWLPMLGTVWDPAMYNYYLGKSTYAQFASTVNPAGTQAVQLAAGQ
jgi:multiple sugar transport system substrate-binding protein